MLISELNIPNALREMRKERGRNQEQVAEMLGISRVTYNLIENAKSSRKTYRNQIEDVFDVSVDALTRNGGRLPIQCRVDEQTYLRVKDIFLYILSKTSNLPNVGKTVLYKILYFCEFDRYEQHQERLLDIDFVKLPRGPAPAPFDDIMLRLEKEQSIVSVSANYNGYVQQRYIINQDISDDILPAEKKKFIDNILDSIGQMNAREVSDYSHGDLPRKATKDMQCIDINLALHRQYPYSVRAKSNRKKQAQQDAQKLWVFDDLANEPDLYEEYR